jgi:hypothetical protein
MNFFNNSDIQNQSMNTNSNTNMNMNTNTNTNMERCAFAFISLADCIKIVVVHCLGVVYCLLSDHYKTYRDFSCIPITLLYFSFIFDILMKKYSNTQQNMKRCAFVFTSIVVVDFLLSEHYKTYRHFSSISSKLLYFSFIFDILMKTYYNTQQNMKRCAFAFTSLVVFIIVDFLLYNYNCKNCIGVINLFNNSNYCSIAKTYLCFSDNLASLIYYSFIFDILKPKTSSNTQQGSNTHLSSE